MDELPQALRFAIRAALALYVAGLPPDTIDRLDAVVIPVASA